MRRLILASILLAALVAAVWLARGRRERGGGIEEVAEGVARSFDPGSLSARAIPQTDLPPPGTRSLFDHILKEEKGLPYPFEKLVRLLASYDTRGRMPAAVLIPDGRSLLKGRATFARPRIVVAANALPAESDHDFSLVLKSRLFLGFVEDAAEIEVLSYNEEAGRFEFQRVEDYREGGAPRISYARRAICLACHSNAAPIFPLQPWDETSAQAQVSLRIAAAMGQPKDGGRYHGVPVHGRLRDAETVDNLTDAANVIATTQRIWIDGCGGDPVEGVECRRTMLRLALTYGFDPDAYFRERGLRARVVELQRLAWPAGGMPVGNPNLANRNPLTEAKLAESWWRGLFGFSAAPRGAARDAKIADFEKLPPLRPELDPLTPRVPLRTLGPDSEEGVFGVAQLLSANDERLLRRWSGGDLERLGRALDSESLRPLLEPRPFRRIAVMKALLAGLGARETPASCCDSVEGMSPPTVEGGKPLAIAAGSVVGVYEKYCFACHRGNPVAKLDFMSGDTEAAVIEKIRAVSEVREVLDYERYHGTEKEGRLMPPAESAQRRALDEARARGGDDLERMVAAVPKLFDF